MKIIILFFIFLLNSNCFASPGRLGGFSYNFDEHGNLKQEETTKKFNDTFMKDSIKKIPQKPFYLEFQETVKNTTNKYNLVPTYSETEIHDINFKHKVKGFEDNSDLNNPSIQVTNTINKINQEEANTPNTNLNNKESTDSQNDEEENEEDEE